MSRTAFNYIAVTFTASGSGTPFGAADRIGAIVRLGIRMADDVREIEVPVLLDNGGSRTLGELRNEAVSSAVDLLRTVVSDLDGQTYDALAARQDSQDEEREREFQESLRSNIVSKVNSSDDQDRP
jgi:hypothetical protein